ncbi:MAG: ABC transporter permease subunit [Streptosporangiales bacterium]|nr:ABC transporter permease subunit [Streptosporangiales bacterium]
MSTTLFDVRGPRARVRHGVYGVLTSIGTAALVAYIAYRLYASEQITGDAWEPFQDPEIVFGVVEGFGLTLLAAVLAIALSIAFGVIFAAGRLSDSALLRIPSIVVVEFFRAVPLVLMILAIFLGFGDTTGRYGALIIALMLYNGSVLAETFRAGINAVPRGQSEAAYAIGMRKTQVMLSILTPQAVRIMLPAIISQCVVALKDTALGFIIASPEAVSVGKQIYSNYGNPIVTGLVLAVVFIAINYTLSKIAQILEGRQRRKGRAVLATAPTTAAGGAV